MSNAYAGHYYQRGWTEAELWGTGDKASHVSAEAGEAPEDEEASQDLEAEYLGWAQLELEGIIERMSRAKATSRDPYESRDMRIIELKNVLAHLRGVR